MSSPFANRSAAVCTPLGIRFNGESVLLLAEDAETIPIKAIVDIQDSPEPFDGPVDLVGTFRIPTAAVTRWITPHGFIKTATIRTLEWHVYEKSPDREGWTWFSIRRQLNQSDHTNMFDMNDQQATWGSG